MFGLALEGGGTRGAYHIGVIRAVKELNIEISHVVGTSIGAVNGAMFAAGKFNELTEIWHNITADCIIQLPKNLPEPHNIFDIKNISSFIAEFRQQKGLDISPFEKMLNELLDEKELRNGEIDFGLVTFCLTGKEGKQLFLKDIPEGMLIDYLSASCCLPGFKSKNIENDYYIDGGVVNNLPVNMLTERGVKDIISVGVGGVGITKRVSAAGCNVIPIECKVPVIGILDFDRNKIIETEKIGYYDAMKAFGKCCGDRYFFDVSDYYKNKIRYGEKLFDGISKAAEIFGLDKYRIYKFEELVSLVLAEFEKTPKRDDIMQILKWTDMEKTAGLACAVSEGNSEILNNKIIADFLGEIFDAASAIAYFNMQNIQ